MTRAADRDFPTVVASAAKGDEVAFARLVARFNGEMHRVCVVVARDRSIAEEAVQAAWLIAWRKLGKVRDPERVRPWLVSVAVNEVKQLLRKQRRRSQVETVTDATAVPGGFGCWAHFFRDPLRTDEGTWLVAAEFMDADGEEKVIMWRSLDGVDWDVAREPEMGAIWALARAPNSFVATIDTEHESYDEWVPQTLESPDGLEWQMVGDPKDPGIGPGETIVYDSAGPIIFAYRSVLETEGLDGPEYPAFAATGPIDVPLVRFVEGEGWMASESGITNAAIWSGSVTADGRLLLVGQDLGACESAECMSEEGGDRPALWVGTPE